MSTKLQPYLLLQHLRLSRAGRAVLNIDKFELWQKSLVLLTGANGSGKTSLLKVVAGLITPQRASISCNDITLTPPKAAKYWRGRHIYLHQQPYLFNSTVHANVAYGLELRGQPRLQRDLQVFEALQWAQLEHLADRPANELSTGEQQRIALTRARILNPSLLLLDEITANMDVASRKQTKTLLTELRESGVTVVVASHEADFFSDIADTHLELDTGLITGAKQSAEIIRLDSQMRQ